MPAPRVPIPIRVLPRRRAPFPWRGFGLVASILLLLCAIGAMPS